MYRTRVGVIRLERVVISASVCRRKVLGCAAAALNPKPHKPRSLKNPTRWGPLTILTVVQGLVT